jgi:chromosome segregation ATPase
MSAISIFLLGDPQGKYPCAIPNMVASPDNDAKLNEALRDLERVLNDNKDYQRVLDNIHESYKSEMQMIRAEAETKIDFLRGQLERLQRDNDNLWAENARKSKIVDQFIERFGK